MRNALVKYSVLTLALAGCTTLYAAANTTTTDVSTIPTIASGFDISLTGLYLQPGASDLQYAVHTEHPLDPITNPAWAAQYVNPAFTPAFDLGIRYVLQDTTQDVSLDWMYLNTNDSASVTTNPNGFVAPPYIVGPNGATGRAANATAPFNFNNVNFTFGQKFNFGNHLQVRFGAGLQFANIEQNLNAYYTGVQVNPDPTTYAISSDYYSRFLGAGPRLALNGAYYITPHFSIVEALGGAVLLGQEKANSTVTTSTTGQTQTITEPNEIQVVPEIDGKVGVAYAIPFSQGSSLTIESGYMASVYVDAFKQVVPTSVVSSNTAGQGLYVNTLGYNTSDFDINGPYLTVNWKF